MLASVENLLVLQAVDSDTIVLYCSKANYIKRRKKKTIIKKLPIPSNNHDNI